jgi:hypothetical protein
VSGTCDATESIAFMGVVFPQSIAAMVLVEVSVGFSGDLHRIKMMAITIVRIAERVILRIPFMHT